MGIAKWLKTLTTSRQVLVSALSLDNVLPPSTAFLLELCNLSHHYLVSFPLRIETFIGNSSRLRGVLGLEWH